MPLPAPAAATAHELAENVLKNVGKAIKALVAAIAAEAAVLERRLAEPVIGGPLLRIPQAIIGFVDRLEPCL